MFASPDRLDWLRSHSTEWLEARRVEVVGEDRRLQSEEHAILSVLDERGRIDTSAGLDGESARTVRATVETARALESLPAVAAAARAGDLSAEQPREVVKLADAESDGECRAADALMVMCDAVAVAERVETPMAAAPPSLVTEVGMHGPATVVGIPLPDAMVEQLRASATVEPLLVDDDGFAVAVGRRARSLSWKVVRAVLVRDGHCHCGHCDLRYGLQVHHRRPRSWGGRDDISNLAAVASVHHPLLIPNGPDALVGNPNLPDGLRMVHVDQLTPEQAQQMACRDREPDPEPHECSTHHVGGRVVRGTRPRRRYDP